MTTDDFRVLALSMPLATEGSHMDHPDFRVKDRIFATLSTIDGEVWGMVKLTPEQQHVLIAAKPRLFQPVPGGWGVKGATQVRLAAASLPSVRNAMLSAWQNVAPRKLVAELGRRSGGS